MMIVLLIVAAVTADFPAQRQSLLDLYNLNVAANPLWPNWPANKTSYCNWTGVTCLASNSSVQSISLSAYDIVSMHMPASFANLTDCIGLAIANNLLTE